MVIGAGGDKVWCRWWGEEGRLDGTRRRSNNSLVILSIGMMIVIWLDQDNDDDLKRMMPSMAGFSEI